MSDSLNQMGLKQGGKKTGKFSHHGQAPPEPSTIDWDAIREARNARLDEEIARGIDNAETRARLLESNRAAELPSKPLPPKPRKSRAQPKGTGPGRGGRPRFSRHQMGEMWLKGMTTAEIAAELGCSTDTVRISIKDQPWYDSGRDKNKRKKGGRPPREFCPKGHSMAQYGKQNGKNGRGRYCTECQRIAQRERYNRKRGKE